MSQIALPDLLTLTAATPAELLARLERGERDLHPGNDRARLAIVDPDEKKLALARKAIEAGKPWRGRQQIYFTADGLASGGGKVALLFPGLDSGFEPRAADLARYFGVPLPPGCEPLSVEHQLAQVIDSVLEFNEFLSEILARLDVRADAVAGHSIGELSALRAGGVLPDSLSCVEYLFKLEPADTFQREIAFLMAGSDAETVTNALDGLDGLYLTHDNCPHQAIVCGRREPLERLRDRLRGLGIIASFLPFAGGFHSPYFEMAQGGERRRRTELPLADPRIPVWSAASAAPFPKDESERQALLHSFMVRPVRFRELIDGLHAAGHRIFVQVGTGSLAGFIGDTLAGRPHAAIALNQPSRSGLAQLVNACALLWAEGVSFDTHLLAAGAPRLGATLPRSAEPGSPGVGLSPALELEDPVRAAILRTLKEIDEAREEVLQLLGRHRPGGARRQVLAPPSRGNGIGNVPPPRIDLRITRLLDLRTTIPYVADHSLHPQRAGWPVLADWNPVVPMTMEIQMVRRAAEETLPGLRVIEVRNAQAYRWLAVADPVEVTIVLRSRDDGVIEAEIEGYFRAELHLAAEYPEPPPELFPPLGNPRAAAIDAGDLYRDGWMFHGPAYQGVTRFRERGDNGLNANLRVPPGEGALLDNMGQVAGYWLMEEHDACFGIPIGVDRLRFFAPDPEIGTEFHCEVRVSELDELTSITRHRLTDAAGRVQVLSDGWRARRYQVDQEFRKRTKLAQTGSISLPLTDGVVLFEDHYDTAMVRDYIARRYLAVQELAEYETLAPRRRRQWLNGRCAAKDAVRLHLHALGVERIFPKELVIANEESGRPRAHPNVTNNIPTGLQISLSHKDGYAVAIASDGAVGIDLERIEPRGEEFIAMVLSAAEREVLGSEPPELAVTRAWVAKEAAAKARGSGLGGNPRAWIIEARSGDDLCINGQWVTTQRLAAEYIIGWTIPAPGILPDRRPSAEGEKN